MKKAFTLTELLIALGVVGVLAAILMPVIHSIMPNQNVIMAKRAFALAQTAVSDMINDSSCYPDKSTGQGSEKRIGFDYGYGYENCLWGGTVQTGTKDSEGDYMNKFTTLYAERIGANDDEEALTTSDPFFTKDGMKWSVSIYSNSDIYKKALALSVDVNGTKDPNCFASGSSISSRTACATGKNPDSFTIKVFLDGRMRIDEKDTWAIDAINVNKGISD